MEKYFTKRILFYRAPNKCVKYYTGATGKNFYLWKYQREYTVVGEYINIMKTTLYLSFGYLQSFFELL